MKKQVTKKIQKWDEVTGTAIETVETVSSPEEQAEGPELTSPADNNPLKNAEMAMEDDYDSIDGIINNGPKKDIEEESQAEQRSVMEKIHEHEEKIKQQNQLHHPEKKKIITISLEKGV